MALLLGAWEVLMTLGVILGGGKLKVGNTEGGLEFEDSGGEIGAS